MATRDHSTVFFALYSKRATDLYLRPVWRCLSQETKTSRMARICILQSTSSAAVAARETQLGVELALNQFQSLDA